MAPSSGQWHLVQMAKFAINEILVLQNHLCGLVEPLAMFFKVINYQFVILVKTIYKIINLFILSIPKCSPWTHRGLCRSQCSPEFQRKYSGTFWNYWNIWATISAVRFWNNFCSPASLYFLLSDQELPSSHWICRVLELDQKSNNVKRCSHPTPLNW